MTVCVVYLLECVDVDETDTQRLFEAMSPLDLLCEAGNKRSMVWPLRHRVGKRLTLELNFSLVERHHRLLLNECETAHMSKRGGKTRETRCQSQWRIAKLPL